MNDFHIACLGLQFHFPGVQRSVAAQVFSLQIEIPSVIAEVSDPPLMIRPEDRCDPESLRTNAEVRRLIIPCYMFPIKPPCLLRITLALKNYSRIFGDNGFFNGENTDCSKWRTNATAVAEVIKQLLVTLQVCTSIFKNKHLNMGMVRVKISTTWNYILYLYVHGTAALSLLTLISGPQEPWDTPVPLNLPQWMTEEYLCRDSADRLYSFSIVVARVFSFLGSRPQMA
ncbi:uncharacterized protein LOC113587240 [Electrophorus electricus]|uniref:uncharacterized protein LOC113587240 n=1 Tax=Electrophorus electricus TaxID=8005 RepID=UPI0015D0AAAB|nr:uncharacterized protein LOC113587240 [Electrophorus electricus]